MSMKLSFLLYSFGKMEILFCVYVCCTEHQKSFLCPTISSTQRIYLPPTPTQPYTHACPTATGSLCAYMHISNQVIWRNQIKAENQSVDKPCNNLVSVKAVLMCSSSIIRFLFRPCAVFFSQNLLKTLYDTFLYLHDKIEHLSSI